MNPTASSLDAAIDEEIDNLDLDALDAAIDEEIDAEPEPVTDIGAAREFAVDMPPEAKAPAAAPSDPGFIDQFNEANRGLARVLSSPIDSAGEAASFVADRVLGSPEIPARSEEELDEDIRVIFSDAFAPEARRPESVAAIASATGLTQRFVEENFDRLSVSWQKSNWDAKKWRKENPSDARLVLSHPELRKFIKTKETLTAIDKAFRAYSEIRATGAERAMLDIAEKDPLLLATGPLLPLIAVGKSVAREVASPGLPERLEEAVTPGEVTVVEDARAAEGREAGTVKKGWFALQDRLNLTRAGLVGSEIALRELRGEDTADLEREYANLKAISLPRNYLSDAGSDLDPYAVATADVLASTVEMAAGAIPAAAAGSFLGPGGAAAGAIMGATAAPMPSLFGNAYMEYRDIRLDNGNGEFISREAAAAGAYLDAALQQGTEALSFGATGSVIKELLKELPENASGKAVRAFIKRKLQSDKGWASALTTAVKTVKDSGMGILGEGGEEWLATTGAASTKHIVKEIDSNGVSYLSGMAMTDEEFKYEDVRREAASAAAAGVKGSILPGVARGSLNIPIDLRRHFAKVDETSKASAAAIKTLIDVSKDPVTIAAPEEVAKKVREQVEIATGFDSKSAYIDVTEMTQQLNQDELAKEIGPEAAEAYREAVARGDYLEIPLEQFHKWANSPFVETLKKHAVMTPGILSPAGRESANKRNAEILAANVELYKAESDPKPLPGEVAFTNAIAEQLREATGMTLTDAKTELAPLRGFVRSMASRFKDPARIFDGYTLSVQKKGLPAHGVAFPSPGTEKAKPAPEVVAAAADAPLEIRVSTPEAAAKIIERAPVIAAAVKDSGSVGMNLDESKEIATAIEFIDRTVAGERIAPLTDGFTSRLVELISGDPVVFTKRLRAWSKAASKNPKMNRAESRKNLVGDVAYGKTALDETTLTAVSLSAPTKIKFNVATKEHYKQPVEYLRDRAKRGLLLRDFATDINTGAYNVRGFEKLEINPEKPNLAFFAIEGTKAINDIAGHEALDAALRHGARILQGLEVPWVAKLGGDIVAPVKDEAEAKELADKIRAAFPSDKFGINYGIAKHGPAEELRATMDLSGDDARKRRDVLNAAGNGVVLSARGDLPAAFLPRDRKGRPRQNKIVPATTLKAAYYEIDEAAAAEFKREVEEKILKGANPIAPDAFELDPKVVEAYKGKTDKDLIKDILEDEGSGIGSLDAFAIKERTGGFKAYASIDLAFLRDLNDEFSRPFADMILDGFGALLDKFFAGNAMAVRLHGDEYAVGSDVLSEKQIRRLMDKARAHIESLVIAFPYVEKEKDKNNPNKPPKGSLVVQDGLYFGAGVGSSYKEADGPDRLGADKEEEKKRVMRKSHPVVVQPEDLDEIEAGRKLLVPNEAQYVYRQELKKRTDAEAKIADLFKKAEESTDPKEQDKALAEAAKIEKTLPGLKKKEAAALAKAEEFNAVVEAAAKGKKGSKNEESGLVPPDNERRFGFGGARRVVLKGAADKPLVGNAIERGRTRATVAELLERSAEGGVDLAERGVGSPGGLNTLSSEKDGKKRGTVTKTGKSFSIDLTENADLSTFLHETAHVFMWMLGDLAAREDAPQSIRDDYETLLKFIGASSAESASREQLEKIARGFELYLREGKEPAKTLRNPFMRFGIWLKGIYRDAKQLDVEISPEVRGIFDRLIATDDQIQAQANAIENRRLFSSPEDAGMPPAEWERYVKESDSEMVNAARRAELGVLREKKRVMEDWRKKEMERFRADAAREYDALPAVAADNKMRGFVTGADGKTTKTGVATPLDAKRVAEILGTRIAPSKVFTSVGGLDPDAAAMMYGFQTGEELVKSIVALEPRGEYIEKAAEARMTAEYPGFAADLAKIAEVVKDAISESSSSSWRIRELDAIRARIDLPAIPEEVLKGSAAAIVGGKKVKDLDLNRAERAERKAAIDTARHMATAIESERNDVKSRKAGDDKPVIMSTRTKKAWQAAEKAKRAHILNYFVVREMRERKKEIAKFETLVEKARNEAVRQKIGFVRDESEQAVMLDSIDAIMALMGESESGPDLNVPAAYTEMKRLEAPIDEFDLETFRGVEKTLSSIPRGEKWDSLTFDESKDLRNFFTLLLTTALNESKAIRNGKDVDFESLRADLMAEAIAASKSPWEYKEPSSMTAKERALKFFSDRDAELKKPAEMLLKLGGQSIKSAWYESVFLPLEDAAIAETDLRKKVNAKIIDAFQKIPRSFDFHAPVDGRALFPSHRVEGDTQVAPPSTKGEILMLLINTGTESSRERLLTGRNITLDEVVAAADKHLTPEVVEWAKALLEQVGSLWPEVKRLQEREVGVAPDMLPPVTTTTKHGSISGYFPAVYVPLVTRVGTKQDVEQFLERGFLRPSTSKSHTHNRVEGFTAAISLDPKAIVTHLDRVTHDLTHREAVKSVARILRHPEMRSAFLGVVGPTHYRETEQWLKEIGLGLGHKIDPTAKVQAGISGAARFFMVWKAMGLTLTTPFGDVSNIPRSIVAAGVNPFDLVTALPKLGDTINPFKAKQAYDKVLELSGMMRARHDQVEKNLHKHIKEMTSAPAFRHPLVRSIMDADNWFITLRWSDILTTTPIWAARYQQSKRKGMSSDEAIREADRLIERIFPSNKTVHMSAIMRNKGAASALLMFHGYWNTEYNVIAPLFERMLGAESKIDKAKLFAIILAYMSVAQIFGEIPSGRGPEDDEEWAVWYGRKMLSFLLSVDPVGGEIGAAVESLVLDRKPNARNMGPAFIIAETTKAIAKATKAGGEGRVMDAIGNALSAVLPYQVSRTGKFASDVSAGNTTPTPLGTVSGAIYGERKNQGTNPVRLAEDLLN